MSECCEGCGFNLSITERDLGHRYCVRCMGQMHDKFYRAMANVAQLSEEERRRSLEEYQAMPLPPLRPYMWIYYPNLEYRQRSGRTS